LRILKQEYYLDGSEKTLLGINIGVLGFGLAFLMLLSVLLKSVIDNNENKITTLNHLKNKQ